MILEHQAALRNVLGLLVTARPFAAQAMCRADALADIQDQLPLCPNTRRLEAHNTGVAYDIAFVLGALAGAVSGAAVEAIGYATYFAATALLGAPAFAFLPWARRWIGPEPDGEEK